MNENWKFSEIPYTRPDVEALQARYDALTRRARDAAGPEELLQVVRDRDALQQEVSLCQSIATIRAFHDVTDAFYQTEFQETLPRLETLDSQSLAQAIVESPYAQAVDEAFGPQLRAAQVSPDRDRRKAAFEAERQTVLAQADTLEQLLRDLVRARNDLARANGFDNFADYGDLAMQRVGYGRAELDEFCRQVRTHITPVYLRFQEEQRRRLGVDVLMPYDRPLVFPEGNAVPVAEDELPWAARRMYHALSPEAGEFFDEMVRRELLDVAASPNKISGMGFCEELAEPYRMPFVFANCSGTASDVTVYTHELGHGLQGYLSAQTQPVSDYIGLSPDLAEVHSKTMELLPLPYAPGVVEALAQTLRHQPTP